MQLAQIIKQTSEQFWPVVVTCRVVGELRNDHIAQIDFGIDNGIVSTGPVGDEPPNRIENHCAMLGGALLKQEHPVLLTQSNRVDVGEWDRLQRCLGLHRHV